MKTKQQKEQQRKAAVAARRAKLAAMTPEQRQKELRRRKLVNALVPLLLVFAGIIMMLYPVIATRHNDIRQQEIANSYLHEVQQVQQNNPDVLEKALAEADEYNRISPDSVILDPFLQDVVPDAPAYQHYLHLLNWSETMGQIRIPKISVSLPIYHGTDAETLRKGVGHLFGSNLPVGGNSTHTVVTGHSGLPDATMFDRLTELRPGDAMYLNVAGRQLKYEVFNIQVVEPRQTEYLKRYPDQDLLTLITCTPYGINSHRLLVTGKRVPLDPNDNSASAEIKPHAAWKWWMVVVLIVVGLVLLSLLWPLLRLLLGRKRRKAQESSWLVRDQHLFVYEENEQVANYVVPFRVVRRGRHRKED